MKIAIDCKSPLLQKSLELFLKEYLSSYKNCDILIQDKKCVDNKKCFYISSDKDADLIKPFSKQKLLETLDKRYKLDKSIVEPKVIAKKEEIIPKKVKELKVKKEKNDNSLDFSLLEKRIEFLTQEYQQNILNTVKAFYEK